jgi:hypothetical protein
MDRFTEREKKLIRKLWQAENDQTLELREACPRHSACIPLPLFRVSRVDPERFEAQWNTHHRKGPSQTFRFGDVIDET